RYHRHGAAGPVAGTGGVRAVTRSAQRKPDAAAGAGADVTGHGLLSRFHAGCRCPWCASRACEGTCGCPPCVACRASAYVVLPRGWQR
ncbi:MAG: hypothetical protein ACRDSH_13455, partial [Pseudonocardiaceae bacterium]